MPKILVVDDSKTIRDDIVDTLKKAGHTVLEAENGIQGLSVIKDNKDVGLIFCDVNMPEMDGLAMCSEVHKNALSTCPIVMLTTEANPDMKAKAKEFGVKAWITKPYQSTTIVAAAKKLLGV